MVLALGTGDNLSFIISSIDIYVGLIVFYFDIMETN